MSYRVMSLIHLSCTLIFFIVAGRLLNVSGFKLDNDSNDGTQAIWWMISTKKTNVSTSL